jgi:LPLT family lysophospholipid transporter-like MFS transporter
VYAQAGIANVTNQKLVLLLIGMVAGIVLGAVLAGQLHRTGDLSWSRRYACIMAAGFAGLGILGGRFGLVPAVLVLVAVGAASGLLLVPLNAALQSESDSARLGKTVSVQNFTDYIGIALGGAYLSFLSSFGLGANKDMVLIGITVAVITIPLGVLARSRRAA